MNISVSFRHMEATDALKDHTTKRLTKLEKYLDQPYTISAVLSVEKFHHNIDVTVTSKGNTFQTKESSEDMYATIDQASEKLARQLRDHKEKIRA